MRADQNVYEAYMAGHTHPEHLTDLVDDLPVLRKWLTAAGAEVLESANKYEVIRFRTSRGTSIVYRRESGFLTWVGEAESAYQHWRTGKPWRAVRRPKRPSKAAPIIRTLLKRDGPLCFYCGYTQNAIEDYSLEHLVALTHGGPSHLANFVLACIPCNTEASHLSVMEKVRLREQKQYLIRGDDMPNNPQQNAQQEVAEHLFVGISLGAQRDRADTGMTLGGLIAELEKLPARRRIRLGSLGSYRGFYEDLAFEPLHEDEDMPTVGEVLADCRAAIGKAFEGYKGGNYMAGERTPLWVSPWGDTSRDRLTALDVVSTVIQPFTRRESW